MTSYQNKLSSQDKALTLAPETLEDLDLEADAKEIQGAAGAPTRNANGYQNC